VEHGFGTNLRRVEALRRHVWPAALLPALLAALLALLLGGCADGSVAAAGRQPATASASGATSGTAAGGAGPSSTVIWSSAQDTAVRAMLTARARAVLDHDRAAFLRTVAPGAGRRQQAAWFARVSSLPLVRYGLDL
jgi:hypothetical protein